MIDLRPLRRNDFLSSAASINERGQVVGYSCGGYGCHAVLWEDGKIIDLGTLPGGDFAFATAINNRGQVVGYSSTVASGTNHAFLWEDGKMTDLGTLPGANPDAFIGGRASDINNRGQVAGFSSVPNGEHAFLWEDGKMTDLRTLPGAVNSSASGINSRGQIVGTSNGHTVLWQR
jgi:probable HAF family extracellular repeat protein